MASEGAGAAGNLNITDYTSAKNKSNLIMTRINNGSMPPANSPEAGLEGIEKSIVQKWIDSGLTN